MLAHPGGVLGGNGVTPKQINQVLLIVTLSFEAPKGIEIPADGQPRTTLFLLKYLECSTADPGLRAKIAETRALLQSKGRHESSRNKFLTKRG